MPTYVFRCADCKQEFQVKVSWREKASVKCTHCGGQNLQELFGEYTFQITRHRAGSAPPECSPAACGSCCANSGGGCPIDA
ncbi:MAG TPA: zinc ribbon domain-containing protein [Firmicutes bacterium]|nr:zinc ribbon domain-containing protein [Bacillota bacterium]